MLLAWQEIGDKQKGSKSPKSDALHFPTRAEVVGSSTVVYWLLPLLDVKAGEETQVRLHDRNTWLTAIRDVRSVRDPEQRTAPPATPRRARRRRPRLPQGPPE